MTSFFVIVEGLEGSGKTEVTRKFEERMRQQTHVSVLRTYEPENECCGGKFIRSALRREIAVSNRTLALAYAANRSDHVDRVIAPYLSKANTMVICDRYYLSSLAYQATDGMTMADVMTLNAGARRPDLHLFFDVSTVESRRRILKRNEPLELFDDSLAEIRANYGSAIHFVRSRGEIVEVVDANPAIEIVIENMVAAIRAHAPVWLRKNL